MDIFRCFWPYLGISRQTQFLSHDIIRHALSAAALAPSYQEALDITGTTLLAVAAIARAEVAQ
nr:hypothetical protein [Paraburkholderia hayleyella]